MDVSLRRLAPLCVHVLALAGACAAGEDDEGEAVPAVSEVDADGADGPPRADPFDDPLRLELRSSPDDGDARLDERGPELLDARVLLGPSVSRAQGISTSAMSLTGEVRLHVPDLLHATVRAQVNHDLTSRSTDAYRVRDWVVVDARGWLHPYRTSRAGAAVSTGLCLFGRARENTPSSEEHAFEVGSGPSLELETAGQLLRLGAGYSFKALEFDDDLPRSRGRLDARGEYHYLHGPFVIADASLQVSSFFSAAVGVTCLLTRVGRMHEARGRAELELNLARLFGGARERPWEVVLISSIEGRRFDSPASRAHLGFRRDLQAGVSIGFRRAAWARRSPRGA